MLKKQRSPLQIDKITVDKLPSVPEFCIFTQNMKFIKFSIDADHKRVFF